MDSERAHQACSPEAPRSGPEQRHGPRPLAGMRVLAVETFLAGPYGSMLLADFGAEVIKVEPPGVGDGYRHVGIIREREGRQACSGFLRTNRNKKSLALDLQSAEGKDLFRRLALRSDVVWENLRPGVMDRLGLGYRSLADANPALIYASVSGFGHTDVYQSPYVQMPAFDIVAQAMSAIVYGPGRDDEPPIALGFPIGDIYAGVVAAFGVVLALQARHLTGRGQHVDISMYDAILSLNEYAIAYFSATGQIPPRGVMPTSAPYGIFRVADGHIVLGIVGQAIWERFCQAVGRPDLLADERLRDGRSRAEHQDSVLRPVIEAWGATRTRAEAVAHLTAAGVPAGAVQDVDELFRCPHVAARRMLLELNDPVFGPLHVAGNPIKLSEVPEVLAGPPPHLGQDGPVLLREVLGLADDELARLRAAGVLG